MSILVRSRAVSTSFSERPPAFIASTQDIQIRLFYSIRGFPSMFLVEFPISKSGASPMQALPESVYSVAVLVSFFEEKSRERKGPMKNTNKKRIFLLMPGLFRIFCSLVLFFSFFVFLPAIAQANTHCSLDFKLKSWSVFYKSGKGSGTVSCDNGQKAQVALRAQGGGITFGKSTIVGRGDFSPVKSLNEIFGSYSTAEGHAGAVKSASGQALSKGDIDLTLTGSGSGADIGFDFGSFKIKPAKGRST